MGMGVRLGLGLTSGTPDFSLGSLQPAIWLKHDDITDVGSGKVDPWNDKTTNGNDADQSTDANRPIFTSDYDRGVDAVVFDTTDVMTVTQSSSLNGDGVSMSLMGVVDGDPQSSFLFIFRKWAGSGDGWYFQNDGNNDAAITIKTNAGAASTTISPRPPLFNGGVHSFILILDNGSYTFYLDGVSYATGSYTATGGFDNSSNMTIFDRVNGGGREFAIVNRVITANEITQANNYFEDTYKINYRVDDNGDYRVTSDGDYRMRA